MRTSTSAVSAIIETDPAISILPFIETASALVEEVCGGAGYDATRMELIERWLSAHFYAIRDPRARSEGVKGITIAYWGHSGPGLQQTSYGQQALLLDTAGGLKALDAGKGMKAGVDWLGTEDE